MTFRQSLRWSAAGILFLISCDTSRRPVPEPSNGKSAVHYAKGFDIVSDGEIKRLMIRRPHRGAYQQIEYWLVPKGSHQAPRDPTVQVIEVPAENIVCTSTTHIPLLDYLGLTDRLIGFPTPDYISSPTARQRIDSGKVIDLGLGLNLNYEALAELSPSVLMTFQMTADFGQMVRIRELGIPVVINAEYLEEHPLGRAEWIRVMGALFGREQQADSVFRWIESRYEAARERAKQVTARPTVLSGTLYGSTWFLPGGSSHAARLLYDAGLDYYWNNTKETGSLELGFEAVYEKAHDADLWIGAANFASLKEMAAADQRYSGFRSFREGRVYTYTRRIGARGGNEYLELGYLRPDIILDDLIAIAHPEAGKGHSLFFFRKVE